MSPDAWANDPDRTTRRETWDVLNDVLTNLHSL